MPKVGVERRNFKDVEMKGEHICISGLKSIGPMVNGIDVGEGC